MRKILFVTSENPLSSADRFDCCIAASLKQNEKCFDVRIISPMDAGLEQLSERLNFEAQIRRENQNCTIFSCKDNDITYYFVEDEYFRNGLSGGDNAEQNAQFCQAVLEALPALDFFPDILHALDCRTALSVVYLKEKSKQDSRYAVIRCVLTFRNHVQTENIGLKRAVECADAVVLSPENKNELSALKLDLEKYRYKFYEINGSLEQENDLITNIATEKKRAKAELQRLLGFPEKLDVPLIGFVSRLTDRKKLDILTLAAEELLKEDVQFVVLGKGDAYFEKFFQNLSARYPQKVKAVLSLDLTLAQKICAGADMCLIPGNMLSGKVYSILSEYGTVPIMHGNSRQIFDNENIGFTFSPYSAWNLLGAIKRALALYQNREAWKNHVKKIIRQDFLRKKAAEEYIHLHANLR